MYRLNGLKIYQGVKLIATAANPAAAQQLLDALNGDTGYPERVLRALSR
jgi:ABC-type Fe3+ transport system substrate-binding protein